MATNPNTPAVSAGPPQPPAAQLPFIEMRSDGKGYLTIVALQLLQYLYSSIGGSGGSIDTTLLSLAAGGGGFDAAQMSQLAPNVLAPIQFRDVSHSPIPWTPVLAGDMTPGTQTYAVQWGELCYIGPVVLAQFSIVLTALDAATAGNMVVGGLPVPAQTLAGMQAGWLSSYSNVTQAAGLTQLGLDLGSGDDFLQLIGSGSALAAVPLPVAGVAANTTLKGGVIFFR